MWSEKNGSDSLEQQDQGNNQSPGFNKNPELLNSHETTFDFYPECLTNLSTRLFKYCFTVVLLLPSEKVATKHFIQGPETFRQPS